MAVLVTALPVFVFAFLVKASLPALFRFGPLAFLTDARWAPTSGEVGLGPMIVGTLLSSTVAVTVAAPLGVAYGLHVNLFASRPIAELARAVVALLAGIPSVVFGLVALLELVPRLQWVSGPGLSLVAAIVVLTAMILPTVAATADAAIRQVDPLRIAGARCLGLGRFDTARAVIVPLAAPALGTGVLLALGRAFGETMAVLMVAGNTVAWPLDPFKPFRSLTGNVAIEMAYATGVHRSALFVTGLLLLLMVGSLVLGNQSIASRKADP